MSSKNIRREELDLWEKHYVEEVSTLANELLTAAKSKLTYGEAFSYIKQVDQRAIYDVTKPENWAARSVLDAVYHLVCQRLNAERNELPIKKNDDGPDGGDSK